MLPNDPYARPKPLESRFDISRLAGVVDQTLTERQRAAFDWISTGATNAEIARQLAVSQKTVEAELTAIFKALGVGNRIEAAVVRALLSAHAEKNSADL